MTSKENLALVEEWFRHFQDGNDEALHGLQTDDIVWDVLSGASEGIVPWLGEFHGRAGVDECLEKFRAAVDVEEFEVRALLSDDDHVASIGWARFTAKPSGTVFEMNFVEYFHFRDGKISYIPVFGDTALANKVFSSG